MLIEDVVLLQGTDALYALTVLQCMGEQAALEHLRETYYGRRPHKLVDVRECYLPTKMFKSDEWLLQYDPVLQYISLVRERPDLHDDPVAVDEAVVVPGEVELLDKERRDWYLEEAKRLNHKRGDQGDDGNE